MPKPTRGGLGRGLNSLLGGSYEGGAPSAPIHGTQRVIVNEEDVPSYSSLVGSGIEQKQPESEVFDQTLDQRPAKQEKSPSMQDILAKKLDEVPIESISPNPDQPRTNFKKEDLEELAASISRNGLLQPILVRSMPGGGFQIIAGERRWQACKSLGLKTVPIRIKDVDDDLALELALIENVQRADLNPIEEAYGYKRLMERRNLTQSDVAQAMSKGRSTVANALRLLELPEEAQQLLFEGKISAGHARAILSIPSKEGRQTLTNKLIENKLSVREAESFARLLAGKSSSEATPRQPLPASYKKVAKTLRDVLGTNVRVKAAKGKNKIEIEFKDEEELERLFEELLASIS